MPHFVTHILHSRRTAAADATRGASGDATCAARADRHRLARLHTPAPDTLRVRVRRELRAAAAATTDRSE